MTDQQYMPDPEKVKQTIAKSRRRRLEMEISGIELEEVIAKLEHHNRQQRLNRIKQTLSRLDAESNISPQETVEVLR
ncbi:MAG: hypothetical protein HC852_18215 [Acaryochloridaceae cyanobacterium RU_4_10]|nr:hypothetical protein [Acaryochloridaceae cyanobacterium RU_4_10]